MRRKAKITIIAMAVMLLMALAVTVTSFSFAGEEQGGEGSENTTEDNEITAVTLTNVDYIIKNSNDESLIVRDGEDGPVISDDREYRIVEIGSGSQSTLGSYVANKGFENYVLNGNKSASVVEDMYPGKVVYTYLNAKDITKTSTTNGKTDPLDSTSKVLDFTVISQADMIYISNNSKPGYSATNDISEDLLTLLQPMAVGSYIPIIIDMPSKSGSNGGGGGSTQPTAQTVGNVIGDYYAKEGMYYYTFGYDSSWTAEQYFDTALTSVSKYLPINPKSQSEKGAYSNITIGSEVGDMAKLLVISKEGNAYSGSSTSMSRKLLDGASAVTGATYSDNTGAVEGTVVNIQSTKLYENGYNIRYDIYRPKYAKIEEVSVADLSTITNMEAYDIVFIESDVKDEEIEGSIAKKLADIMYGNIHVAYDISASNPTGNGGSGGSGSGSSTEADNTNYKKFYEMISSGNVASYQNVLLTDKTKLDIITGSTSAAVAKTIADLINASSYRGIGGPGSASSSYAVLEIQPCYPIDETIAAANNGSYYTKCDAMVNGLTREEIDSQRKEQGLLPDDYDITVEHPDYGYSKLGYEYYNWELSKAMIAEALDMNASDIILTQMSTEEFSSNKDELLGKYDLIYIGGNTSAIKSATEYYSWAKLWKNQLDQVISKENLVNGTYNGIDKIKYAPIYRMYSHNGDMVSLDATKLGGFEDMTGTALLKTVNGNTATSLNGNDLSSANLEHLRAYVDAGMPIIFSKDVTDVYSYMATDGNNRYLQNSIDPESNMCKLLDYCNTKKAVYTSDIVVTPNSTNVLWNLDVKTNTEFTSSDGGRLSQYANQVKVLNQGVSAVVKNLCETRKKPKLVVTSSPTIYNFFDKTTVLTSNILNFKVDSAAIASNKYSFNLYIDDNGNSIFDSNECIESASYTFDENSENNKKLDALSVELDSKFNGPVYWKFELVDERNSDLAKRPKVFITGLSYIKPSEATQQKVNVLEIMPGTRNVGGYALGESTNDRNTLYFCVDCQQGYKNLYYNPASYTSTYGQFSYYYSQGLTDPYSNGEYNGVKMGLHEHNFGIVSYDNSIKYGSMVGADDFRHNLADDLTDFDFEIDVMYEKELQRYCEDINSLYAASVDNGKTSETMKAYSGDVEILYSIQKEVVESAEKQLEAMLATLKDNLNSGNWSAYEEIIARKSYSQYFAAIKDTSGGKADGSNTSYVAYKINNVEIGRVVDDEGNITYGTVYNNFYSQAEYNEISALCTTDAERTALANNTVRYTNYKALYEAWATEHDKMLLLKGGFYVNSYTYQYRDWYLNQMSSIYAKYIEQTYADSIHDEVYKNVDESKLTEDEKTEKEAEYKSKLDEKVRAELDTRLATEIGAWNNSNTSYTDGGIASGYRIMGYRDYKKFSYPSNWLAGTAKDPNYTSVLIGASDRFAGGDITGQDALDAIGAYVNGGGQIVLFHDILSPLKDKGAVKLTALLREAAGLDKYHLETSGSTTSQVTKVVFKEKDNLSVSFFAENAQRTMSRELYYLNNGSAFKNIPLKTEGNPDWPGQISNDGDLDYNDLYNQNNVTFSDGSDISNELITIKIKLGFGGNNNSAVYPNTKATITLGDNTYERTSDTNGIVTIQIPAATKVVETVTTLDSKYPVFTTTDADKYPSSKYFMSSISYKDSKDSTTHSNIESDIKAIINQDINATYLPGGYTDSYLDVNGDPNQKVNAYKYVPTIQWSGINAAVLDSQFDITTAHFGSNRAKKNNDAIVNMYPFQLADDIYIGGTHSQAFATDVEYENLTVLYSLVGGKAGHDDGATFAANPSDGTDNYFIYACDNIYMCGAGHLKVTGATKDNLNERYLYLNIICNSARKSAFKTKVSVYDPDSTPTNLKNDVVVKDSNGDDYTYVLEDGELYPNFSFIVGRRGGNAIKQVEIYYNTHYDGTEDSLAYVNNDNIKDVMIANWRAGIEGDINPGTLYYVKDTNPSYELQRDVNGNLNLTFKDAYLNSNNCAYVIIKATTVDGEEVYRIIKIKKNDKLYNLT